MNAQEPIGLGLMGCGAFGLFCLNSFSRMEGVRIAAVADIRPDLADDFARRFGATACHSEAELLSQADVNLVHIATPPALHFAQTMHCLEAGKHVLCDKPLAMNVGQAQEMVQAADGLGLALAVNFVLRYNAVTDAVKAIIDSGVLGKVLSARLTNCATDSNLPAGHWFWDPDVSGGIFIEHGVHFFDLYRHWLGAGDVVSGYVQTREGTAQEDRVTCLVRHESGAIASHYHGFDQLAVMDRTDHRLICEMGDIRIRGWIPMRLEIDAAVNDDMEERLLSCCPAASIRLIQKLDEKHGNLPSRGRQRQITKRVEMTYLPHADKNAVYAESLRLLLADQIAFIRDPSHRRRVTGEDGLISVAMAEVATYLGRKTRKKAAA